MDQHHDGGHPSSPSGYSFWTYADPDDGYAGVQQWDQAPDLGATPGGGGGYIRATPSGNDYYIIQEDGTMYQYGDATTAPGNINKVSDWNLEDGDGTTENPVTGMAITPSGQGGWVLDAKGHVYPFGDAKSFGQPGSNEYGTAVDIVATANGQGYTIVTDAGHVYDYGNATYYGHPKFDGTGLNPTKATGIALAPNDAGYWIVDDQGGVHAYGNAQFLGNNVGGSNSSDESTDIAALPDGTGYAIVTENGNSCIFSTDWSGVRHVTSQGAQRTGTLGSNRAESTRQGGTGIPTPSKTTTTAANPRMVSP